VVLVVGIECFLVQLPKEWDLTYCSTKGSYKKLGNSVLGIFSKTDKLIANGISEDLYRHETTREAGEDFVYQKYLQDGKEIRII
jgi:hypothetical protein